MLLASLLLTLGAGALKGISIHNQAKTARQQAAEDTSLVNQQISDQLVQLDTQKEAARGTLLADAYAIGVQGTSVNALIGKTVNEYQKQITRGYEQIERNDNNLSDYVNSSKWNEALNIGSTLIGTGSQLYSMGLDYNLWGNGKLDPKTGQVIDPYFKQLREHKNPGSILTFNGGY